MRILFLDDMAVRHQQFMEANADHEVTRVFTADEAITELSIQEPFDIVSLDHDLDAGAYEGNPKEKTGQDVAKAMVEGNRVAPVLPKLTIVHSLNGPGSIAMVAILEEAGARAVRIPFAWMRHYEEAWLG